VNKTRVGAGPRTVTRTRRRHEAGFIRNSPPIGKCHRSITPEIAQILLRSGVFEASVYEDAPATPDKIYNVYRGIPYEAVVTQGGKSYHGYPWAGRMSVTMREALRARAVQQGMRKEFDQWLKAHSKK
jgi:hypothetical protein